MQNLAVNQFNFKLYF